MVAWVLPSPIGSDRRATRKRLTERTSGGHLAAPGGLLKGAPGRLALSHTRSLGLPDSRLGGPSRVQASWTLLVAVAAGERPGGRGVIRVQPSDQAATFRVVRLNRKRTGGTAQSLQGLQPAHRVGPPLWVGRLGLRVSG
jgi:hypothetical protein